MAPRRHVFTNLIKLPFRDGFVWMEGQTLETKLHTVDEALHIEITSWGSLIHTKINKSPSQFLQ